jgi:hypothetical protein
MGIEFLPSQGMHTVHREDVTRLLMKGMQMLPSTSLSAMEVLNATSDHQRNRRLDLACRYYAQFQEWSLPMDEQSIELLKLRLRHGFERVAHEDFQFSSTVSPLVYVLTDVWHRHSPAWLKERTTIELFSAGAKPKGG